MILKDELKQLGNNTKKDVRQLYEKVKQYPLFSLFFILVALSLVIIPYLQVNYQGISNNIERATLENQYRATFAQILGGVAIGIGLYYTWRRIAIAEEDLKATQENLKVAQENLKVSQESQITERFTRAIDQLGAIDQFGNPAIEIRLGGIYALERIANESEKDYWPIIEILTAYVRKNSNTKEGDLRKNSITLDIQAVMTIIGRRRFWYKNGENNNLNLKYTYLKGADMDNANLDGAELDKSNLKHIKLHNSSLKGTKMSESIMNNAILSFSNIDGANFYKCDLSNTSFSFSNLINCNIRHANLEKADIQQSDLKGALLEEANLLQSCLYYTNLEEAKIQEANLKETDAREANLERADFLKANLEGADFEGASFIGALNLSIEQLSKVKTLYNAKLDKELEIPLREKYPALFEKPDQEEV